MADERPWWETYFDRDYEGEFRGDTQYGQRAAIEALFVARVVEGAGLGPRVLDLACGFGRHSIEMLRLGLEVISLDRSEAQLATLAERAKEEGLEPRIVKGDMRDFTLEKPVDAAVLMFSSFGYFSDEENQQVLASCRRAVRPEGMIVLDCDNHHSVPTGPYQFWRRLEKGGFVLNEAEVHGERNRRVKGHRIHVAADGQTREYDYEFALYDDAEITAMLHAAGFENVHCVGNFDASPLTPESPRQILLAR